MTLNIHSPLPTGKFAVGVTSHSLVDRSRVDLFAPDSSQWRELTLQIWYPADPPPNAQHLAGKTALPWVSLICPPRSMAQSDYAQFFEAVADQVQTGAETWNMPKRIGQVETQAYAHAPLSRAGSPYPVVLYSHGNGGYVAQTAYILEELASHGYIVIAVGHTHDALLNVFPDGRMIPRHEAHPLRKAISAESEQAQPVFEEIKNSNSPSFQRQRVSELYIDGEIFKLLPTYPKIIQQRRDDLAFVIDELYPLNTGAIGVLEDALDLNRLAAFGYSLGGEGLSELCVTEGRIRVGVALDSLLWGYLLGRSISQPFFCIYAEKGEREEYLEINAPAIIIQNTKHGSFSSSALWWESLGETDRIGTISIARCHEITRRYVLAYLNHHLYRVGDFILSVESSVYPEVSYLYAPLA